MKLRLTEQCKFQLIESGTESFIQFAVVDVPNYLSSECDGVLGWGGLKDLVVQMDPSLRRVKIRETINFEKTEWKCMDIRTDLNILVVKTPSDDTTQDSLLIDTGFSGGLTVRKELWQQLTNDETNQNTTLLAIYTLSYQLRFRIIIFSD